MHQSTSGHIRVISYDPYLLLYEFYRPFGFVNVWSMNSIHHRHGSNNIDVGALDYILCHVIETTAVSVTKPVVRNTFYAPAN